MRPVGAVVKVGEGAAGLRPRDRVRQALAILLFSATSAASRASDPVQEGWRLYRAGAFGEAIATFSERLGAAPGDLDARTGLGYAQLQAGRLAEARAAFERVLAGRPGDLDARGGLGETIARGGGGEARFRADADPARPIAIRVRALEDIFEVRQDGAWKPFFVRGINLGAALPGRFPTEFPREVAVYRGWLGTIADAGANAVRVYTLLPPEFYRALVEHNAAAGAAPLRLVQGVWAELPERHDFSDPRYVEELRAEVARVVDAVHGDLALPPRPGHASGHYDADASPWLLAYLLGREWEPYAVKAFDARHPDPKPFEGEWFRAKGGSAMESWSAALCDFAAGYAARRHRSLVPIAFTSWPTLDPLHHPSEASRAEEDAWRRRYGLPFPETLAGDVWEDDAVTLDPARVVPTARMLAGSFAAYHVYPNYPDFMNVEGSYEQYLRKLERHHGRQPLLVAEFGISTSRGVAHVASSGWHHGGHDERRQGELIATMLDAIRASGCAGGIVFELMDEWFKGTWSVAPLRLPAERRRLWFDAESPEPSYGIVANRPAAPVVVDGDPSDWTHGGRKLVGRAPDAAGNASVPTEQFRKLQGTDHEHVAGVRAEREAKPSPVSDLDAASPSGPNKLAATVGSWATLLEVHADSDAGYLYLLLKTAGGPAAPDWREVGFRIAIDTYDATRGETALPEPGPATIATGAEFLVDLLGPDASRVRVSAPYEPYAALEAGPIASPVGGSGSFVPLDFETNRERFARDGARHPAIRVDRGVLRFGSLDPRSPSFDTRTDVAVGAATGTIELRLPWGLLGVADPSSRRVLHQGTVETDGFRLYAFAVDPGRPAAPPASRLPEAGPAPLYTWPGWETPEYRMERKHGFDAIRRAFHGGREIVGGR